MRASTVGYGAAAVLGLALAATAMAQVITDGAFAPAGAPAFVSGVPTSTPVDDAAGWGAARVVLGAVDLSGPRAEDAFNDHLSGMPFRVGVARKLEAPVTPATHGAWFTTADGRRGWRVMIESPGASAVGVNFSKFKLPPGARVLVGSPTAGVAWEEFKGKGAIDKGYFNAPPAPGSVACVEYLGPPARAGGGAIGAGAVVFGLVGGGAAGGVCWADAAAATAEPTTRARARRENRRIGFLPP